MNFEDALAAAAAGDDHVSSWTCGFSQGPHDIYINVNNDFQARCANLCETARWRRRNDP